ncbi:MAG: CopG family transcriptional regulator [Acidobacteriota bacterium]
MRISARLDADRSRKLEALQEATNLATSEILKRALDMYFEKLSRKSAPKIFDRHGFVGSGTADPELSERYKEELAASLAEKHDYR